jgi:hypothetical protein
MRIRVKRFVDGHADAIHVLRKRFKADLPHEDQVLDRLICTEVDLVFDPIVVLVFLLFPLLCRIFGFARILILRLR